MARRRGLSRARRFARRLRVLAEIIRRPGLRPHQLADMTGVSESTLFRDLAALRRLGYVVRYSDGYQLQEPLGLDGSSPDLGLAAAYARHLELMREHVPPEVAKEVEEELKAEAPAALAAVVAQVIERRSDPSGRRGRADRVRGR